VQPPEDHTPGYGQYAFLTGPFAIGTTPGTSDVDSGRTSLTSPPMDLTRYDDPELNFRLWYTRDQFPLGGPPNDTLHILVSTDDGTNWVAVRQVYGTNGEWEPVKLRLRTIAEPTATVRIRFVASDVNQQSWVEAAVDDFSVIEAGAASAPDGPAAVAVFVAPNPARDRLSLHGPVEVLGKGAVVELLDMPGRVVLHHRIERAGAPASFDVGTLAAGTFVWRVSEQGRTVASGVVVVTGK
jgi:hypothetical protein